MTNLSHLLVVGATHTGKTTWLNELQRRWPTSTMAGGRRLPAYSILVDTKGQPRLWGRRIQSLEPLSAALMRGPKLVWDPPRRVDGIAWEQASRELLHLWAQVQVVARRLNWQPEWDPWLQVILDEVHKWMGPYLGADGKRHHHPSTVADMASMGLGIGLRLAAATQHPAGIDSHTRDNLTARVVFRPGDEGRRCLQSWGWPAQAIAEHTRRPHAFAAMRRDGSWSFHEPLRT